MGEAFRFPLAVFDGLVYLAFDHRTGFGASAAAFEISCEAVADELNRLCPYRYVPLDEETPIV